MVKSNLVSVWLQIIKCRFYNLRFVVLPSKYEQLYSVTWRGSLKFGRPYIRVRSTYHAYDSFVNILSEPLRATISYYTFFNLSIWYSKMSMNDGAFRQMNSEQEEENKTLKVLFNTLHCKTEPADEDMLNVLFDGKQTDDGAAPKVCNDGIKVEIVDVTIKTESIPTEDDELIVTMNIAQNTVGKNTN